MLFRFKVFAVILVALLIYSTGAALCASMILNEYNAVVSTGTLKDSGTDSYFGSVTGNGGDWMEFVVINDNLDIRGWTFVTTQNGSADATIILPSYDVFSSLRSGTIFTIAENVAEDLSYNPVYDSSNADAGDWWINYNASFSAGDSTHKNFQVTIKDASGNIVFGPAGEGVSPTDGIGSDEVFKLEANPSASITANSPDYNDGTSSTFGSPNLWSDGTIRQDFSVLRSAAAVPEPSSIIGLFSATGSFLFMRRKKK